MLEYLKIRFQIWKRSEEGMAAVEAAIIFPVMLVMLMGVYDLGNAILANQKTIRASQVVADLIARQNIVSNADIADAVEAGRLAFEPIDSSSFGVDIVSIRFDDDAASEIVWRETVNMTPVPNPLGAVSALEDSNEGVVMVSVVYEFTPLFAKFAVSSFGMREVGFSRGRNSPVINRSP